MRWHGGTSASHYRLHSSVRENMQAVHNELINADPNEMTRTGSTTDDINIVVSRTDVPVVFSRLLNDKRIAVKLMPQ